MQKMEEQMLERGLECNPPIKFSYGGVVSQTTGALSHSPPHASMVISAAGLYGPLCVQTRTA